MIGGFARFVARTFFRDIVIEGSENLPGRGPMIFTPNHPNGLLDPMLLFFLSPPFRLRFVAKAPLFKIPIFGSMLRSIGAIPVVRKFEATGDVDYTAFFGACVDSMAQGDCIVIFPEGRSLPQSYLAPLKTGPARLSLLAQKKGISAPIVPVGLNYEKGTTFRSDVLVRIGQPLKPEWNPDENESLAVRQWTEKLTTMLEHHVIQAESYQERELLLLLDRLSAGSDGTEFMRFARLKQFENGLSTLRVSAPREIDALRKLLSRYERLAREYGLEDHTKAGSLSIRKVLPAIGGAILAIAGWILNVLPYQLCDWLIKATKKDAADTATFKVIYSLFLFPLFYALEAYILHRIFGSMMLVIFLIVVLPLSYFTLFYFEWYESRVRGMFWPASRKRMKAQLERLRARIMQRLDALAASL